MKKDSFEYSEICANYHTLLLRYMSFARNNDCVINRYVHLLQKILANSATNTVHAQKIRKIRQIHAPTNLNYFQ